MNKMRSNETVRNSFILTAGTVVAQMIPLLFMLVLTRFYSNESFGLYQLFYQITVVLGVVANGRLEQPVLVVKNEQESLGLFQTATKLSIYISIATLILFTVFAFLFPSNKIVLNLGAWLWILPISIFLNANTVLLSQRLNRFKKYRNMVVAKIILVLFTNAIPATAILFQWNNTGLMLIVGFLVGQIISVWYSGKKTDRPFPSSIQFSITERMHLSQQKSFLYYSAPALLIDQLAAALPLLFIAVKYGTAATGDMGFAQRVLIVPSVFIAASVSQVFFKQASDYAHLGKNLLALTIRIFGVLLLIGLVPYLTIIFFGHLLLPIIFGSQWLNASHVAQIMACAMLLKFAVSPVSVVMTITNRIRLQAVWQMTALVLNVALAAIAWKWLDMMQYIITLTIMDGMLYLFYLGLILYSTKKQSQTPVSKANIETGVNRTQV